MKKRLAPLKIPNRFIFDGSRGEGVLAPAGAMMAAAGLAVFLGGGLLVSHLHPDNDDVYAISSKMLAAGVSYQLPSRINARMAKGLDNDSRSQPEPSTPGRETGTGETRVAMAPNDNGGISLDKGPSLLHTSHFSQDIPLGMLLSLLEKGPVDEATGPHGVIPERPAITVAHALPAVDPRPVPAKMAGDVQKMTPAPVENSPETEPSVLELTAKTVAGKEMSDESPAPIASVSAEPLTPAEDKYVNQAALAASHSFVEARLAAAEKWLQGAPEDRFSMQLMVVNENTINDFNDFYTHLGDGVELEKLFFFRQRDQRLLIFLGDYASPENAKQALTRLDAKLRDSGPYVMPIRSVRDKVARVAGTREG